MSGKNSKDKLNPFEESKKNLKSLASQLALNYLDASAIDLFQNVEGQELHQDLEKWRELVFKDNDTVSFYEDLKKRNVESTTARNVLVLGAGCTFNAFSDIPLGDTVKMQVMKKITVWEHKVVFTGSDDQVKEHTTIRIDFLYFARFVLEYFKYEKAGREEWKKTESYDRLHSSCSNKDRTHFTGAFNQENKHKFDILYDIFSINKKEKEGEDDPVDEQKFEEDTIIDGTRHQLLYGIGVKYYNDLQRLNLILEENDEEKEQDEYGKSKSSGFKFEFDKIDFETSLFLLEQVLPVSMVRQLVKEIFDHSSGPIAFYELVAHLFKNRFIDVIINFNFDEFLDLALEDEIGEGGYEKIISDGDCRPLGEFSPVGRLRQPLYIKPHGTASHKSTLRFTKNHYHDTPLDMRSFLEEVISCKSSGDDEIKKYVNLITVGFNMESVEFNAILRQYLPKGSMIFSFYHHREDEAEEERDAREKKLFKKFGKGEHEIEHKLIGHEFFKSGTFSIHDRTPTETVELHPEVPSLGNTMLLLYKKVQGLFHKEYMPRDINEHEVIINLFGNERFYKSVRNETEKNKGRWVYPKDYFSSPDYYQDRVLLEILLSLANNNGALDPGSLMKGRCGKYYSKYQQEFSARKNKKKSDQNDGVNETDKPVEIAEGDFKKSLTQFFEFGLSQELLDKQGILLKKKLLTEEARSEKKTLLDTLSTIHADPFKLEEYKDVVEQVVSEERTKHEIHEKFVGLLDSVLSDSEGLKTNSLFSEKMKRYILNEANKKDPSLMIQTMISFNHLVRSQYSKVSSRFRSTSHHVFENYETTNLLNTDMAMDLHFSRAVHDKSSGELMADSLLMVVDTGVQFFKFIDKVLNGFDSVKIILSIPSTVLSRSKLEGKLIDSYLPERRTKFFDKCVKYSSIDRKIIEDKVRVEYLEPDQHNEHMWVFVKAGMEPDTYQHPIDDWQNRAIYYQKKGYSKYINPIRIVQPDNIIRLINSFQILWNKATLPKTD